LTDQEPVDGTIGFPRFLPTVSIRAAWAKAAEGNIPLQADDDDHPGVMLDKCVSMLRALYEQAGTPQVEFMVD
jgi:hypothetical protein